jgi:hypothetical protein
MYSFVHIARTVMANPLSPTPAIDIAAETLITLPSAARRLPPFRNGRPVSASTIWRWITVGINRAGGYVVRLEAVRLGGRWLTSVEALTRFAMALTPDRGAADVQAPTARTAAQRERASRRAEKILLRRGACSTSPCGGCARPPIDATPSD